MTHLFEPLRLRKLEIRNRVFVSPMCQYSAEDGMPNDWHLVHLGSRAVGGAGLVIAEATAVSPEGRISPEDTGIWNDAQADFWGRIARFVRSQGAAAGVQLAHAGRKASTYAPWRGHGTVPEESGGWPTVGPSALAFGSYAEPRAMDEGDIDRVVEDFAAAARRARDASFEAVEIHMAHGYLLHQFLSPLSNRREDEYGGSLEHRARLPLRVARAVRAEWPDSLPVLVRISATDWVEGGWDVEQSVKLAKWLREAGVDLIDCSSGGLVPGAKIPVEPGYQAPFARAVREGAQVATGAVGLITEPQQAEEIVTSGGADAVLLARALLRDPYWPIRAARALGAEPDWPAQYLRAREMEE
ncbi:MAG TPA: NADH:flavin oxidoreductase/NADH oxidase [Longimicrobiaceae bacterium]|nr:NADH:flavin oxidoreductase/NADH oxidase [Longimicrobiaceae bacterium]